MTKEKQKTQVLKKNGSIENFDPGKIARVTNAAGLNHDEAQKLSTQISHWAKKQNRSPITSLRIRKKVIEELQKVNPRAANLYIWYKNNQDQGLNA